MTTRTRDVWWLWEAWELDATVDAVKRSRHNASVRNSHARNRDKILARSRARYQHDPIAARARVNASNRRLRLDTLLQYSRGKLECACCGERELTFLTLDHVNGDGAQHRRSLSADTGASFYRALKMLGYPDDPPLEVVCQNCNYGRWAGKGVCPHRRQR